MRAVRIHTPGAAEVLTLDEIAPPEPGPGQVRVRVEAVGVNFIDVYHRSGRYPLELPATLGMECAGVVDRVGPDVSEVGEGDRVAATGILGAYADLVVVPVSKLAPLPDHVTSRVGAAVMLQGITAHYLTHSTFALGPEHTAVVLAAAGGVGHLLVQVAKLRGARVIGTASTEAKARLAREAGADEVIPYRDVPFDDEVRRLTEGVGADVVYDSVGADTFEQSLSCLRRRGLLALYGRSSGPAPPVDPQLLGRRGSLFLTRPGIPDYMADRDELLWRTGDLFRWLGDGSITVTIDRTWPLDEAAEAHRYIEEGRTAGKVLLVP